MQMLSRLIMSHLTMLVWSIVATLMVIYGTSINQRIRRALKPMPFLGRVVCFVMICAVGYGWLSWFIVKCCVGLLIQLSPTLLIISMLSAFCLVGCLAERRRMI
jgi:hypothetical protein